MTDTKLHRMLPIGSIEGLGFVAIEPTGPQNSNDISI